MSKFVILWLGALLTSAVSAAVPDIQFSFNKSTQADFGGTGQRTEEAVGSYGAVGAKCRLISGSDKTPAAQLVPGVSGTGLKLGLSSDGKSRQVYSYDISAAGLNPGEGSVSFWVRPLSWDGKDKNYHNFVSLRGTTRIFINYTNERNLSFSLNEGKKCSFVKVNAAGWKRGSWHHIAAVWDSKVIQLYIDGNLAGAMENNITSRKAFKLLNISEYWTGDPGTGVIDELLIFTKKLDAEKVMKLYRKHQAALASNDAPLEFSVAAKTPSVDGKIECGEYSFSAEGLRTVAKGSAAYSSIQNRWYCAWDEKNFYVALKAPGGKLRAAADNRDGHVYNDDCIEFFIQHPVKKKVYQFIINSRGTVFDSFGGDPEWNSRNIKTASKLDGRSWQIELAVPWKDVGITPREGMQLRMNLCRSIQTPRRGLSIVPLPSNAYNDPPQFAAVTLTKDSPELFMGPLGVLSNGKIDTRINVRSAKNDKLQTIFEVDSQLQPFKFRNTAQLYKGGKKEISVKGIFRINNTLNIAVRSEKYGMIYRTAFEVKEAAPARYSYVYTDLKKQDIVIVCENALAGGSRSKLRITLKPAGKNNIVYDKTVEIPNDRISVKCRFPLGKLPCGEYLLEHYLMDVSGKVYAKDWEYYGRFSGREDRFNTSAGLEDAIPAPFTMPVAEQNSYKSWGRTVKWGGKGLISSIISAGKEILSGPVRFRMGGKDISFTSRMVKKCNSFAEYLLMPADAPVPFKIRMRAEFDGLLWFTVVLPAGKTVDSAELLLTLDRRYVDSYDDCASIFYRYDLNRRKRRTYDQNPAENHFFWLGNYDRGIMGGNQSMRGWFLKNKKNGYHLEIGEDKVCMSMRFIDTPLKLKKERSFSFYLHPTPVRPRRTAELWKIRMESNPFIPRLVPYINSNMWQPYYTTLFDHKDKDFIKPPRSLKQYIENAGNGKWRVFWYCAPKGTSPYSYEWNYYGEDWVEPEPVLGNYRQDLVYSTREQRIKGIWMNACLNSRSFFNFKMRQIENFINSKKFNAGDLYFDLGWPRKCGNELHGCAWTDEFGYQHRDYDLLAMREFNLRMARIIQKKRPDAMILGHLQQTRTPADSFYDLLTCGEPYNHRIYLNGGNYYDILTPELARIAYGYRSREVLLKFGPNLIRPYSLFAPEKLKTYDAKKPENDAAILHLLGYVMTHGLETCEMYPGHGTTRFIEWRAAQDAIGWDENLKFYPYWQKDISPAVFEGKNDDRLLVSSYVNPETGKAVVAVLNDTKNTVSRRLLLDSRILVNGKKMICRSAFENKEFAPTEKALDLKLKPRQFIMLTVMPAK